MPRGLVRYQQAQDLHFITFSCHLRQPYLATASSCELFEQSLEKTRLRFRFYLAGYVVMPEHVHLLLTEPPHAVLWKAIKSLKLSVAVQSTQRPFWLPRYYDFNVFSPQKRIEKLRYLHRNPVSRGLVADPSHWRWSSYNHHATGVPGTVEIESHWTQARRKSGPLPKP